MRVFVLCTGRCGSTTFIKACEHIENFSAGHESLKYESLSKRLDAQRLNFPDNHIEADNRLSWFLGDLDMRFDDDTYYVHLKREKKKTVNSFNQRWNFDVSIIRAFCVGILMIPPHYWLNDDEKVRICELYYDTVTSNIDSFLRNKKATQTINIETIQEDFAVFWKRIGAKGDFQAAIREFQTLYNRSNA